MYDFSPMMQSLPICVEWRTCTLSQIAVPRPMIVPGSIIAVGWTATSACLHSAYRRRCSFQLLDRRADALPLGAFQRSVSSAYHFDRCEGIPLRDNQLLRAENGAREIVDLIAERLDLVVAVSENVPFRLAAQTVFRFLPSDENRPVGAVDAQIRSQFLVDAPRKVRRTHYAVVVVHEKAHGVLNAQSLRPAPFDDLDVAQITHEIAQNVHGVRAVVDQHAAPADGRIGVPTLAHVDARRKRGFHANQFADGSRFDEGARFTDVLDVPEL